MTREDHTVRTTCAYCGVGCGVLAGRSGEAVTIRGDAAHPANHGRLCSKGSALADTLGVAGRILEPRVYGRDVRWDEALDVVARRFTETIARHGAGAVAFYVSGQLLTEDYYVANKLMKGYVGSANIDTNSRLCMSSSVVGHQRAFGEDVVPGCYEDFELADLVVLAGSNAAWCHPVLFRRLEEARRRRPEMQIVVIDPRRTATCELADLHLAIRPGTDVGLFNGLLAYLDREGCTDAGFVERHTIGSDDAIAAAVESAGTVAAVAAGCALAPADVERFFRLFGTTERVVTAYSQGVNQSSSGSDKVTSILNCHLLTGRIGKPGAGPFSLTGQPNAMGGREVGGMASMLAAHMNLQDSEHRRLVQEFWRSPRIASRPGLKAVEMFEAVRDGRIKALWIMATNPAVSLPDADRVRDAIAACEFVVVSDCVADTETTRLAHVLLPASAWGERDGTTTNSERTIARQRAIAAPAGNAKPDWWIISQVASRMGHADAFAYASAHQIFDEHARLSATGNDGSRAFHIGGLAGLSAAQYDRLDPIQWPVAWGGHGGTARLFGDGRFFHPSGRAHLVPTTVRAPFHATCARFPLVLNTGRVRDQWHTMTRTGLSARLAEHCPEPFADLHEHDAEAAGIHSGDLVRVTTRWGSAVLRARTSGDVSRGSLFVPMHWSAVNASTARAGALVNPVVDQASGEPEFKHTPAAIERVTVAWNGVLFRRGDGAEPPHADWWTLVRGDGFVRYELAGMQPVAVDWTSWSRRLLGASDAGVLEYADEGAAVFRAASVAGGRLEACLFVSQANALPPRDWIADLFAKPALDDGDRMALLAARPLSAGADASPLVCSCFHVRQAAIRSAIARGGLVSTAQIGSCLKAGTNCGSCLPELRALLASESGGRSAAA